MNVLVRPTCERMHQQGEVTVGFTPQAYTLIWEQAIAK